MNDWENNCTAFSIQLLNTTVLQLQRTQDLTLNWIIFNNF